MKFALPNAEVFVPDGSPEQEALARTTCMAIGAHQDDLEIMAFPPILECFQQDAKWFTGVVVTNGSGSPRDGVYSKYTDDQMIVVRRKEQKKAAVLGEYAALAFLDHPSSAVKDGANMDPVNDLKSLLEAARPTAIYTHNLADKHDTHIGVTLKVIAAARQLPKEAQPKTLLGCEVWRDLDWLVDEEKVPLDCSGHPNLQAALLGVFDSQIAGGKRYDLATMGRRTAHATYFASHATDVTTGLNFAMDLTPLLQNQDTDPLEYVQGRIQRFMDDVAARVSKMQAAGS